MEAPPEFSALLRAAITFFSVISGFMAVSSGWRTTLSVLAGEGIEGTAEEASQGIADGFVLGLPFALFTLIIEATAA